MTRPRTVILLTGLLLVVAAPHGRCDDAGKNIRVAASGNAAFAFDLYARIRSQPGNLFLSPYSISTALAMTWGGARGKTAKQMSSVLHFTLDGKHLHPAMRGLMADLKSRRVEPRWEGDPDGGKRPFQLVVANRLWGQKGYGFRNAFLDLTRREYGAGLTELDFKTEPESARQVINAWVEKKTERRIKDLLGKGQVTAGVRLILTNAIYFKAQWEHQFYEAATRSEPFHLSKGETAKVPIMHQAEHHRYFEARTHHVVAVPYKGRQLEMVLLVPKAIDGLGALERGLTQKVFDGWMSKLTRRRRIALALPRFETTSRFELSKALQAMGMTDAFQHPAADFSGMASSRELFIGFVIHKAFVKLDEKGTEAAAATAVGMLAGGKPAPPIPVRVDRPFLFLLRDTQTGSLLFMGRIVDPR